jgi:hypothetical protein
LFASRLILISRGDIISQQGDYSLAFAISAFLAWIRGKYEADWGSIGAALRKPVFLFFLLQATSWGSAKVAIISGAKDLEGQVRIKANHPVSYGRLAANTKKFISEIILQDGLTVEFGSLSLGSTLLTLKSFFDGTSRSRDKCEYHILINAPHLRGGKISSAHGEWRILEGEFVIR